MVTLRKNLNLIKRYSEAILYIILLIVAVSLCITNNMYITMIPIAFLVGMIGQIIFGKRVMTSLFIGILSVILLQMKTPANIILNLINTF